MIIRFSRLKRNIAVLAVFCMVLTLIPINSFALETSDISNHWAKDKIQSWMDRGLIKGYEDGTFRPDNNITRAEFMSLVNGAFGISESVEINYSDVGANAWYSTTVAKAKAADYISGYPDNTIKPNNPISRAEAASIIMKINKLEAGSSGTAKFTDESSFSWSKDAVNAVSTANIMNGYPDGSFKPQEFIKRSEAVVALDKALAYSKSNITYNNAGTYGPVSGVSEIEGNVTVAEKDIILQNMIIKGNLIIGKSVGDGNVTLKNVTVKGETKIYGGGQNSIIIIDSTLGKVTVSKQDSKIRIVVSGNTSVKLVQVNSGVTLEENNLTGGSAGFQEIVLDASENDEIILVGSFDKVTVESEGLKIQVPKETMINTLILNEKAKVTGSGTINTAYINASGATLETATKKMIVADGIIAPEIVGPQATAGGGGGGRDNVVINAAAPVIITDLTNQTIRVGTPVTLDATATVNDGGTISYAWYSNTTASTTGGTALGITTAIYSPAADTAGVYYYYCVVTNTNSSATGAKTATVTSAVSKVTVAPPLSSDATLRDLTVNGTTVTGFSAGTLIYNVELAAGTTVVPTVAATVTDTGKANAVVTAAGSLPGSATVVVTAEDGTTQTYTINFTVAPPLSSDATLRDLTVNGTTVTGFSAGTLIYNVELAAGTTVVPTVAATVTDTGKADAVVTAAGSLPGSATVVVTAEDGTTQTYTINFTVAVAPREITGFTALTAVDLDDDDNLVDLAALRASNLLPATVTVTDGTTPTTVAINGWIGTFNGTVTGANTLTAVWAMPEGYADVTEPISVTITVNVNIAQTVAVTFIVPTARGDYFPDMGYSIETVNNIQRALWGTEETTIEGIYLKPIFKSDGNKLIIDANNITQSLLDWLEHGVDTQGRIAIELKFSGEIGTTSDDANIENKGGTPLILLLVDYTEWEGTTIRVNLHNLVAGTNYGSIRTTGGEMAKFEVETIGTLTPVTDIVVTSSATTISEYNGTLQMNAIVQPSNAYDKTVRWSVEDGTGSARISNLGDYTGVLFAGKNGAVTVVATSADNGTVFGTLKISIEGQSTVERDPGNTGGAEATFDASTNTFSGSIDYYAADASVGRTVAGNYVGVQITAPVHVTVNKTKATFKYINASGEEKTLTGAGWLDGDNYVYYYPLVTDENKTFTVEVDWDGSDLKYAPETIVIKVADNATLEEANKK